GRRRWWPARAAASLGITHRYLRRPARSKPEFTPAGRHHLGGSMWRVVVRRGLPSCPRSPRRVEPRRDDVEEPDQRRAVAGEPPPGLAPRERYDVLAVWHRRDDAAVPVREHGPPTVDEE